MHDEEDSKAIDAFKEAVHRAREAWDRTHDEP
jgi:hypothetical protein